MTEQIINIRGAVKEEIQRQVGELFEDKAELNSLRTRVALLEDENRNLKSENAELREKCMTRFARIKNAANADAMARMLHKIYMTGMGDARPSNDPRTWNGVGDIYNWLLEVGTI